MNLNKPQQKAVNSNASGILALGVPGCGKSTVLTERIRRLLKDGASPQQMLCITFTKKAAGSLKEKLADFLSPKAMKKMTIGTSHAFCLRVIRQWADKIGYTPDLTIYDEVDRLDIVTGIIKAMGYKIKPKDAIKVFEVIAKFDKPGLVTEADYVYKTYLDRLKQYNALDYDLILLKAVWILQNCPEALKYYQDKFKYLFYDEFQDLATLEHELTLTMAIENSFVVGDPDQNIYTFRGTDIKYIMEFQKNHPGCEVINLEYNYRSTEEICEAANCLVLNNKNRVWKVIRPRKGSGWGFETHSYEFEDKATADHIYARLTTSHSPNIPRDIAILVRTNRQMDPIKRALEDVDIPVQMIQRNLFWQRREVKDFLAFLRLIANPKDNFSANRILGMPYLKIGRLEALRLRKEANSADKTLLEVCAEKQEIFTSIQETSIMVEEDEHIPVINIFTDVSADSGYIESLEAQMLSSRANAVREMEARIAAFEAAHPENTSLQAFLDDISEISAIDSWDENKDAVSLMTMHCAKGLEWPVVFVTGCNEGLIPMKPDSLEAIEEERRLFYVAITRAKDDLILSRGLSQRLWGDNIIKTAPSRFLAEMKGNNNGKT